MTNLQDLMHAAEIELPVTNGDHPSNRCLIEGANGSMRIYDEGGHSDEQADYIVALLNAAPQLLADLASLRRANLELQRRYDEQKLQEGRLEEALRRAKADACAEVGVSDSRYEALLPLLKGK